MMEVSAQITHLAAQATHLLKALIQIPSLSREEEKTADLIQSFLQGEGLQVHRKKNNVWVKSSAFNSARPTLLLNSHHDTVKATPSWTLNPFAPVEKEGKLFGLGSNDAGASLVTLLAVFIYFEKEGNLPFNLIFAASAEEEISGENGIVAILDELGKIDLGIVGEPTRMQLAVAEKGLMVLDAEVKGLTGHAARSEGENAIFNALPVIEWFKNYRFPKKSEWLGEVKMTVTQIQAGTQHNVIPDLCKLVVDVRTTDCYSNRELFELICKELEKEKCSLSARSFRLNSSGIDLNHPLVLKALDLGMPLFGSPTLSDQALLPFPTVKIGPGDSARSHTADEFIHISEIKEALPVYIALLKDLNL